MSDYTADSSREESTLSMSSPEPRKVKKCKVKRKHRTKKLKVKEETESDDETDNKESDSHSKRKKRKIKSKVKPKKRKTPSPDPQKDTSSDEQSSPDVKNKCKMIGKKKVVKLLNLASHLYQTLMPSLPLPKRVLLHAQKHSGQCSWNMFSK